MKTHACNGKKSFLEISTKQSVNVKPSKIVAGQEPERTNELLQLIGLALMQKISSAEAVKMVRNNEIPKSNKISATKPSKVIKQSSIDSVKTKSKSSDDAKITTLKDNNKIIQKVKESKDRNNEKQVKERKEKDAKISRDGKKSTKDVRVSEKVKSEKVRTKNGTEVKKSTVKSIKEEPEIKRPIEAVAEVNNGDEDVEQKDLMGEAIETTNDNGDLHKSFEPEIVSVQIQSGLSKPQMEQGVNHAAVNGDVPEKHKSARRSGKKVEKLPAEENDDNEASSAGKMDVPEAMPQVTSNGDDLVEPNEIVQDADTETKESKSSRRTSKKDRETFPTNEAHRTANKAVDSRSNSIDATEIPSIPRPRTSLRPPSVRPASARPGAPRRRDRNVEIILQPDGNLPKPGVNIKIDPLNAELDDDGENLVIIEDASNQSTDNKFGIDTLNENDDEQQGRLVQQILETQKEFLKIDEDPSEKRRTETVSSSRMRSSVSVGAWHSNLSVLSSPHYRNGIRIIRINVRRQLSRWIHCGIQYKS